jgi:hypothetical protein
MRSIKTTIGGVSAILAGITIYLNHPEQLEVAIASVITGISLIFAKDGDVTGTGK